MDARKANLMDRDSLIQEYWAYEESILRPKRLQVLLLPLSTAVLVGAKVRRGEMTIDRVDAFLLEEYRTKS